MEQLLEVKTQQAYAGYSLVGIGKTAVQTHFRGSRTCSSAVSAQMDSGDGQCEDDAQLGPGHLRLEAVGSAAP